MQKLYFAIIVMFLFVGYNSFANDKTNLPKVISSTNVGTEFYFSFIPSWESGSSDYLKIYVLSNKRTKVILEVESNNFKEEKYTQPNEVLEFTLTAEQGQPYKKRPDAPPKAEQVWDKNAIHIASDDPIICYAVTRYSYASDAFLVLPTNSLGLKYIVSSFEDPTTNQVQWLPAYVSIIGTQVATEVGFTLGGNDSSRTVSGLIPGQTSTWQINAGDVLLIAGSGHHTDLTGSVVEADKPVAVVAGNYCAFVPSNCGSCNLLEEMLIPVEDWGLKYHVPNIHNRKKNSLIRIFAKQENTNIFRDGQNIGFIRYSGGKINSGYLSIRADGNTPRPVEISGNKPIAVTLYNTAYSDDSVLADPFQMNLIPVEKYHNNAMLFVPGTTGKPSFPNNYIALSYQPDKNDSIPDNMEIGFPGKGKFEWQKLKDYSSAPGTSFSNSNGPKFKLKTIELKDVGVFRLRADSAFQCYSYGFSNFDSYGLPSFFGSSGLNEIALDTIPPLLYYEYLCNGNIKGIIKDSSDTNATLAKINNLNLTYSSSNNYRLVKDNFEACENSIVNFTLERIDNLSDAKAVLTTSDCEGNIASYSIEYIDTNKLYVKQSTYNFGVVDYNKSATLSFFAYNKSDIFNAYIEQIKFKSSDTLSGNNYFNILSIGDNPYFELPIIIPPSDSVNIILGFIADTLGVFRDTIELGDNCEIEYRKYLKAETKASIINVTDIDFPETNIGTKSTANLFIKNTGNKELNITEFHMPKISNVSNDTLIFSSDYISSLEISEQKPLLIYAGSTIKIAVNFQPELEKEYLDSIIIKSNSAEIEGQTDNICYLKGIGRKTIDVNDENDRQVKIYPNPADDILLMENLPLGAERIIIFDELGKRIKEISINKNERGLKISTKELKQGFYILRIYSGSEIIDKSFIIER